MFCIPVVPVGMEVAMDDSVVVVEVSLLKLQATEIAFEVARPADIGA